MFDPASTKFRRPSILVTELNVVWKSPADDRAYYSKFKVIIFSDSLRWYVTQIHGFKTQCDAVLDECETEKRKKTESK